MHVSGYTGIHGNQVRSGGGELRPGPVPRTLLDGQKYMEIRVVPEGSASREAARPSPTHVSGYTEVHGNQYCPGGRPAGAARPSPTHAVGYTEIINRCWIHRNDNAG